MDYLTRVKELRRVYKEETGYNDHINITWAVNFFAEWEKVTGIVKQGAEKRGIDLNQIRIVKR